MDFINLFDRISAEEKEKFLFNILENHKELREKFIGYFDQEPKTEDNKISLSNFTKGIGELAETFRKDLEAVNLVEPDWESWVPPHSGYIEDWEAHQMMVEQDVHKVFEYFEKRMETLFIAQNFTGLFELFFALYKGCVTAEVNDEYDNLGDPEESFINELKEIVDRLNKKVKIALLNSNKINSTLEVIIPYLDKYKKDQDSKFFGLIDELLQYFIQSEITASLFTSLCKSDKSS